MIESKPDTCDWCGKPTNKIQIRSGSGVGLCPEHCPDINEPDNVPDYAPAVWYNMNEDERSDWRNGLSIEDIMEKHEWAKRGQ